MNPPGPVLAEWHSVELALLDSLQNRAPISVAESPGDLGNFEELECLSAAYHHASLPQGLGVHTFANGAESAWLACWRVGCPSGSRRLAMPLGFALCLLPVLAF